MRLPRHPPRGRAAARETARELGVVQQPKLGETLNGERDVRRRVPALREPPREIPARPRPPRQALERLVVRRHPRRAGQYALRHRLIVLGANPNAVRPRDLGINEADGFAVDLHPIPPLSPWMLHERPICVFMQG